VYDNPNFGKKFIDTAELDRPFFSDKPSEAIAIAPLALNIVVDFLKSFHYISE